MHTNQTRQFSIFLGKSKQKIFLYFIPLIMFFWHTKSVWPGWMTTDSGLMQEEALSNEISDLHTSSLVYIWSYLFPELIGPIGPLVIQNFIFWMSIGIIGIWLGEKQPIKFWLLYLCIFFLPATWILGWVWKDATIVSLITLGFAMGVLIHHIRFANFRLILIYLYAAIFGICSSIRLYMLPTLLIGSVILLFICLESTTRKKLNYYIINFLLVYTVTIISIHLFEKVIIKPRLSYHASVPILFDLLKLQCNNRNELVKIPKKFIVNSELNTLCDPIQFNEFNAAPTFWPIEKDTRSWIRFASNESEMNELKKIWILEIKSNPKFYIQNRLDMVVGFLVNGIENYGPGEKKTRTESDFINLLEKGSIAGTDFGWPNNGGLSLAIISIPNMIAPSGIPFIDYRSMGLLWVIVVPLVSIYVYRYSMVSSRKAAVKLLFLVPLIWTINISIFVPAISLRYIAPAILWTFLSYVYIYGSARESI